jgi:small-conductance mechanosensitive channel
MMHLFLFNKLGLYYRPKRQLDKIKMVDTQPTRGIVSLDGLVASIIFILFLGCAPYVAYAAKKLLKCVFLEKLQAERDGRKTPDGIPRLKTSLKRKRRWMISNKIDFITFLVRAGLTMVGIIIAFRFLNYDPYTVIAQIGVIGFAVSFSLTTFLADLFGCIYVMWSAHASVGDVIAFKDRYWRIIRLETLHAIGMEVDINQDTKAKQKKPKHIHIIKIRYTALILENVLYLYSNEDLFDVV